MPQALQAMVISRLVRLKVDRQLTKSELSFINDADTVFVVNEIQESQRVYEMIRPFHRELACGVIVTGNYSGKALKYFQPAGDVEVIKIYPISFEDSLAAFRPYRL